VTIPSPTLAIMVSSPAPPTSLVRFALTVTFATTFANSGISLAATRITSEELDSNYRSSE